MSGKFQVIVLLLLISLFASPNAAITRMWTPGVAAGDWFYFKMYGVYTSNQPNITLAIPQFEYNNTEWARINVTSVEGSMIYQVYTLHFFNGSESNFNFKTNVNPTNERISNSMSGEFPSALPTFVLATLFQPLKQS